MSPDPGPPVSSATRPGPGTEVRWARIVIFLAVGVGLVLRFGCLDRKFWWADEIATWVVLSGCTGRDVLLPYDGEPHAAGELLDCQRVSPKRGYVDLAFALLNDGPQNQPLFFLLSRSLTRALDWEWAPRLVSAVASTLALLAGAALGRELLGSWLAGALVAALAAVSPLHVRFGIDARAYSLWSLFAVLSGWLLLRAYRRNGPHDWWRYGLAQAAALQSHLFSIPASVALLGWGLWGAPTLRFRRGAPARRHVAALAAAAATLVPWMALAALHRGAVRRTLDWTTQRMPLADLVRRWFGIATTIFLRTGADGGLIGPGTDLWASAVRIVIGAAVVGLVAAALRRVSRSLPRQAWTFPLMLGAPLFLALALPDLLMGGRRSMMARYVVPAWWAVELVIAGAFAEWLGGGHSRRAARAAFTGLVLLLTLGAWSSIRVAALEVWWDTNPPALRTLVKEADRARASLLRTSASASARPAGPTYWAKDVPPYQMLAFARLLPPATILILGSVPAKEAASACERVPLFDDKVDASGSGLFRCDAPEGA